ncbi:MAG TPA: SRPBCC family protein [Kutzneria sp.]|jgi:hypothetical protein
MATATTTSKIHVERPPVDVYAFVTTPANWVGAHPVTAQVRGAHTGEPAGVGRTWTEVIRPGAQDPFDAEWTVTAAEPGSSWVIATNRLGADEVRCEIVYTFEPDGGGTDFRREMTVTYPDGDAFAEFGRDVQDPSIHDAYLAKVKAVLEGRP